MNITYPLFSVPGVATTPAGLPSALYDNNERGDGGFFGAGANKFWHGGIHLRAGETPIRAVADGHVIAYRMNDVLQEADLGNGQPAHRFSSGFVLIKHTLVTPRGGEISFCSLYMHLKPMSAEETQQESAPGEAPHIFKKTHYVVADNPHGSGLPVIDDGASALKGVIPFGARFTAQPDDDKCKNERYRKLKVITAYVKGYVVVDVSKLKTPLTHLKKSKGRLLTAEAVPILDDNLRPTDQTLPKNGFFLAEDTPASYNKLRYTKVVCLMQEPLVGFLEDFTACTERVAGKYFRMKSERALWAPDSGTILATVGANAYIAQEEGSIAPTHWTRLAPHNTRRFTKVRVFPNAVTGFALLDPNRTVSVKKTERNQLLDVVDAAGHALATIEEQEEYLALGESPASDSVLAPLTVCRINYPNPAGTERAEGYAFLRAGYDFMPLARTLPDTGTLHLWGESSMTAIWDNGVLDEAGKALKMGDKKVRLEMDSVFELLDESSLAADHWSRQTGWRKVSFTYPARQGQASRSIEGYAFVGSHTKLVSSGAVSAAGASRIYELINTYVDSREIQQQPPDTATNSYKSNGGISNFLREEKKAIKGHSYSWEGHFDGVNVYASADDKSEVQGVIQLGTTIKLKAEAAFNSRLQGSHHQWVPVNKKLCELSDGGFVFVDGVQITKRTELPKPIEFNKVVALANPVPIRRGDIVGFPGQTDEGSDQFHFEVFLNDSFFTRNPSADRWGPSWVHIDPEEKFYVRQTKVASASVTLSLEGPSLVHVLDKDFSQRHEPGGTIHFKLKSAPITGWIASGDIEVAAGASTGSLKKDVRQLHKETKSVTKRVRRTVRDAHNVERETEVSETVEQIKTTGGHYAMNGTVGRTLKVLQIKGEAVQVEVVEETSGWLTKAEFEAKAKNLGWNEDKVYQYELSSTVTLFKDNPAGAYDLKEPTAAAGESLKARVAALPKKRWLDKDWLRFEKKDVEEWKDLAGKTWLGVKVTPAQTLWFDSAAAQFLSPAYDWLDWQFSQEPARPDNPATRDVAENTFDKDGFCDLDSLLEITGATSHRESLPKLRRFGFAHPTEWMYQSDKWARLKRDPWNYEEREYNKLLDYIKSLQWWSDVPGLPPADKVWHAHPIGFIEQLRGMFRLNAEQLIEIFGDRYSTRMRSFIEPLCATLDRYQIITPLRIAHFLAQIGVESGVFAYMRELSPPDYQNRADLGNKYPGDGKTFIGRGVIQITGRNNYTEYEKYIGEDITSSLAQAEKVAEARLAFDSAGWFWNKNDLNARADNSRGLSDIEVVRKISQVINGGCNGLGTRLHYFKSAQYVLCRDIDS